MKKLLTFAAFVMAVICAMAQDNVASKFPEFPGSIKIDLWPDGAPTKTGREGTLPVVNPTWAENVTQAELFVYPAKKPNGQVLLIAPGGAYIGLAYRNEGHDFARWLNDMGVTAAVLHYRMPNHHREVPLEDGRRAIELIREHAAEWGADLAQVGVMGSSAGGHFAATLATLYGDSKWRPAFQILFYPVITMTAATHGGSRDNLLGEAKTPDNLFHYSLENQVNEQTPPALLLLASDDTVVPPVNSYNYAAALTEKHVPVTMLVLPKGEHGFGFSDQPYKHLWQEVMADFLASQRR